MTAEEWLVLDVFRNVKGPYTRDEVRRRAQRAPNFFVFREQEGQWAPVDTVAEVTPDGPPGGSSRAGELEKAVDELLGVCKGIIADGVVESNEAVYLKSWLEQHGELAGVWPANVLSERLTRIFADGVVDDEEREALGELLYRITGDKPGLADAMALAGSTVIDVPEPRLEWEGKAYCLSGRFAFGPRRVCEAAVRERGGVVHEHPNPETDYLVIGALGPRAGDVTHGRNIEFVVKNPEARSRTTIISEENWSYHL